MLHTVLFTDTHIQPYTQRYTQHSNWSRQSLAERLHWTIFILHICYLYCIVLYNMIPLCSVSLWHPGWNWSWSIRVFRSQNGRILHVCLWTETHHTGLFLWFCTMELSNKMEIVLYAKLSKSWAKLNVNKDSSTTMIGLTWYSQVMTEWFGFNTDLNYISVI